MQATTTCCAGNPAAIALAAEKDDVPTRLEIVAGYLSHMVGCMAECLQKISDSPAGAQLGDIAYCGLTHSLIAEEYLGELGDLVIKVYAMNRSASDRSASQQ